MNTPRSVEAAPAKLDADSARTALVAAASQAGLDATDAELVRIGSNAVFRFRGSPVIGRLAPSEDRLESAKRASGWLSDRLIELRLQLRDSEETAAKFRRDRGLTRSGPTVALALIKQAIDELYGKLNAKRAFGDD